MIPLLLVAVAAQAASRVQANPNGEPLLHQAAKALTAGRIDQARIMLTRALAEGAVGPQVDRLLGDIAYSTGDYAQALTRYRLLATGQHPDRAICERAGIAAIKVGNVSEASQLIACATKGATSTARAWDAEGILADMRGDWTAADEAYARAARLAPDDAAVVNNQGWSKLMRGDWADALQDLKRAAALDPNSSRIRNNLELVAAALAADLPQRRTGESDADWAKRLNDAGVAAELLGENKRAVAAFTQALHANGTWYARAANNLHGVREE